MHFTIFTHFHQAVGFEILYQESKGKTNAFDVSTNIISSSVSASFTFILSVQICLSRQKLKRMLYGVIKTMSSTSKILCLPAISRVKRKALHYGKPVRAKPRIYLLRHAGKSKCTLTLTSRAIKYFLIFQ